MKLSWTPRPIDLWGRPREGYESMVFNGIYHIGKIEVDKEKPALLLILSTQNIHSYPVCYRASFRPIVPSEDTARPRVTELSDCFETLEEAQGWCQKMEDRYQAKVTEPRVSSRKSVHDSPR